MSTITRSYQIRAYPNGAQRRLLDRWFGATRWLWNAALEIRSEAYRECGLRLMGNDISHWGADWARGRVSLPKLGALKLAESLPRVERPDLMTLSRDALGRYRASFCAQVQTEPLPIMQHSWATLRPRGVAPLRPGPGVQVALGRLFGSLSLRFVLALLWPITIVASAEVRAEPVWALTFIEVTTGAQGHAGGVLRQQASALREHTPWPAQVMLLQEISRPERFVLVEREKPEVSTDAGREIQSVTEPLRDELIAPPDLRINREFGEVALATGAKADVRANFYVIAHLDMGTPDQARVEAALRQLVVAARQSEGNLRFDIWQQTDRTNHFNLISGWISESQFRAFAASRAAREFRQTVGPLLGSPYDDRLFRRID